MSVEIVKVYRCDRCDDEMPCPVKAQDSRPFIMRRANEGHTSSTPVDLCPKCTNLFHAWWNGKKTSED